MNIIGRRFIIGILAIGFIMCAIITTTLCWQSLNQVASSYLMGESNLPVDVELVKLEKTENEKPIPGTAFYLFKSDGEQIGGRYITDENGKINVTLTKGEYYFEEITPSVGYVFDEKDGEKITKYPFAVEGKEDEEVLIEAYNIRLYGTLLISKNVENKDNSELTETQLNQEFEFRITFSDGGTYSYSIDDGEKVEIASGGTFKIKHGQTATFNEIPIGILYNVTETPVEDYIISSTGNRGNITENESVAVFTNTYEEIEEIRGSITITKEVIGEDEDTKKTFNFTLTLGEKQETFTLANGESKTFPNIPIGTEYIVTEEELTEDTYISTIKEYKGKIVGPEEVFLPFVNVHDEEPENKMGEITITKAVIGENIDLDKEFEFEIKFTGDNLPSQENVVEENNVEESIPVDDITQEDVSTDDLSEEEVPEENVPAENDVIEEDAPEENNSIPEDTTFKLKANESITFSKIPYGVTYTVTETNANGYNPITESVSGSIAGEQTINVNFQNAIPGELSDQVKISITKVLKGEYLETDKNKEFEFVLLVDGKETEFTLKADETKEFEVPVGSTYEVLEKDYFSDGYIQAISNGNGIVGKSDIEVTVTNTYVGEVKTLIDGKKEWKVDENEKITLPESITVRLKNGDLLLEEKVISPDANNEWTYSFIAPKYDRDGNEITYNIEELPVKNFTPTYEGYNIINTYVEPIKVNLPIVKKVLIGVDIPTTKFEFALRGKDTVPMPEDSENNRKVMNLTGSGELDFGDITFEDAGVYVYTICELNSGIKGWTYDSSLYTVTITITKEENILHSKVDISKGEETVKDIIFTNIYNEEVLGENIIISGEKTWKHGNNPKSNQPTSIIVNVYGDGNLEVQKQVTAADNWKYAFELPKYANDGHKIVYTIDEADVLGYSKTIDGYDLINEYIELPDTPDLPDVPDTPDEPGSNNSENTTKPGSKPNPNTGDNIGMWFTLMIISGIMSVILMFVNPRKRKH